MVTCEKQLARSRLSSYLIFYTDKEPQDDTGRTGTVSAEDSGIGSGTERNQHSDECCRPNGNPKNARRNQSSDGYGHRTDVAAAVPHQPIIDERREDTGHQNDGEHADDGDLGQRVHGRMFGDDQRADADEHD